jgi:DNA-binding NarL/FixJ family response regulator
MNNLRNMASPRLLFVEDEEEYLEEFTSQLREDYQYQHIETANSAKQAKEKLTQSLASSQPYDVIITDLRMEEFESGIEVLEVAKAQLPDSQVIILTAHDVNEYREKAFQKGASDYIPKFILGSHIVEVVNESIKRLIAAKQNKEVSFNFDSEIDAEEDNEIDAQDIDAEEDIVVRMPPLSERRVTLRVKHLGRAQLQEVYDPLDELETEDEDEDIVVRMPPLSERRVTLRVKHLGRAQLQEVYDPLDELD